MSFIGRTLGKVVSWIGDAITDVVEFVTDEILKPVMETVGAIIESVVDDPITAILTATAALTGNAWAIPIINGVSVKVKGGSWGDAIKAAAVSYVAGKAGAKVGNYVGEAVGDATNSAFMAQVAGGATASATAALIQGEDPLDALVRGGVYAGVQAGVQQLQEKGYLPIERTLDAQGNPVPLPEGYDPTKSLFGDSVSPTTARVINNVITAGITDLLTEGEVTAESMANALARATVTAKGVKAFLGDNADNLSEDAVFSIAKTVQDVVTATFSDGDPVDAFWGGVNDFGNRALARKVDEVYKTLREKYKAAESKGEAMTALDSAAQPIKDRLNALTTELQTRQTRLDELKAAFDAKAVEYGDVATDTPGAMSYQEFVADAFQAYEAYAQEYYDWAQENVPEIKTLFEQATDFDAQFNTLAEEYNALVDGVNTTITELNTTMQEGYSDVYKSLAEAIDPNFDIAEYAELTGITDPLLAYEDFLTSNKTLGVPTDRAEFEAKLNQDVSTALLQAANDIGLDISKMSQSDLDAIAKNLVADYTTGTAVDINGLFTEGLASVTQRTSDYLSDKFEVGDTLTQEAYDILINEYGITPNVPVGSPLPPELRNEMLSLAVSNSFAPGQGVTVNGDAGSASNYNIAAGNAVVRLTTTGLQFDDQSPQVKYSDIYNTNVYEVVEGSKVKVYQAGTENLLAVRDNKGDAITLSQLIDSEGTLGAALTTIGAFSADLGGVIAQTVADTDVGQKLSEFNIDFFELAQSAMNAANKTGNDRVIDYTAVAIGAGGEQIQAFAGLLSLVDKSPTNSAAYKLGAKMVDLSGDSFTADTQKEIAIIQDRMSKAVGWEEKVGAWLDPEDGLLWSEQSDTLFLTVVGNEIIQEIFPLVFGFGVGQVAKRVGDGLELGATLVQKIQAWSAVGGAVSADIAESYGGEYNDAYQEAKGTYEKVYGTDYPELANEYAVGIASKVGFTAALTTAIAAGVGGAALEKMIFGTGPVAKEASDWLETLVRKVDDVVGVAKKEGGSEFIEEEVIGAVLEESLYALDPTRDVSGNLAERGLYAILGGTGTGGVLGAATQTGSGVANVLGTFNTAVKAALDGPDINTVRNQLYAMGMNDGVLVNDLLSIAYPDQVVNSFEVMAQFDKLGLTATNEEIRNFVIGVGQGGKDAQMQRVVDYAMQRVDQNIQPSGVDPLVLNESLVAGINNRLARGDSLQEAIDSTVGIVAEQFGLDTATVFDMLGTTNENLTAQFNSQATASANLLNNITSKYLTRIEQGFSPEDAVNESIQEVAVNTGNSFEETLSFLGSDVSDVLDKVQLTANKQNLTQSRISAKAAQYQTEGLSAQDAVSRAIIDLAGEKGVSVNEFLRGSALTGTTALNTYTDNVPAYVLERNVRNKVQSGLAAGLSYDQAIEAAVNDVAAGFNRDQNWLLGSLNTDYDAFRSSFSYLDTTANTQGGDAGVNVVIDTNSSAWDYAEAQIEDYIANGGTDVENFVRTQVTPLLVGVGGVDGTLGAALTGSVINQINNGATDINLDVLGGNSFTYNPVTGVTLDDSGAIVTDINLGTEDTGPFVGPTQTPEVGTPTTPTTIPPTMGGATSEQVDALAALVVQYEQQGFGRDQALQQAIADLSQQLNISTTELAGQIGLSNAQLNGRIDSLVAGYNDLTGQFNERFQQLVDQGNSQTEAFNLALQDLATQTNQSIGQVLDQMGTNQQQLQDQIMGLGTQLNGKIDFYEQQGLARDEAIAAALEELAEQTGTSVQNLLSEIGTTETELRGEIQDLGDSLFELVNSYEEQGLARDEALQQAIADLAEQTNQSIEEVIAQVDLAQLQLGDDIQAVADLVGKPATEVTATDIDFVNDLIAQDQVLTELTTEQQQFDVTGDGVLDINDANLLTQMQNGENVNFNPTSKFNQTSGIYDVLRRNQLDTDLQMDQNLQTQLNMQTQMQRQSNYGDLMGMIMAAPDAMGRKVTVSTPDPARIDYLYDFDSIFATPNQASLFNSPYGGTRANGGEQNATSDILKIMGGGT